MSDRLTMAEINERYQDEWVFLEDPITNEVQEVQSGIVRFHSRDCEEAERKMLEVRPRRSALLFIGEIPDDVVIIL